VRKSLSTESGYHVSVILVVITTNGRIFRSKPGDLDPTVSATLFGKVDLIECQAKNVGGNNTSTKELDVFAILRNQHNYPCEHIRCHCEGDETQTGGIFMVAAGSSSFDPPILIHIPSELESSNESRWPIQAWEIAGLEEINATITCVQFIHKNLIQSDDWETLVSLWRNNSNKYKENKDTLRADDYVGALFFGHGDGSVYCAFIWFGLDVGKGQIEVQLTQARCVHCVSPNQKIVSILLLPVQALGSGTSLSNRFHKVVVIGSKGCLGFLNPISPNRDRTGLGFVEGSALPALHHEMSPHESMGIITSATPFPCCEKYHAGYDWKDSENALEDINSWICSFLATNMEGSSYICSIQDESLKLECEKLNRRLMASFRKLPVRKEMTQVISTWKLNAQGDNESSPSNKSKFEISEIVLAYNLFGGGISVLKNRPQIQGSLHSARQISFGERIQFALKALETVTTSDKAFPNDIVKTRLKVSNIVEQESLRSANILLSSLFDSSHGDSTTCRLNASGTTLTIEAKNSLFDSNERDKNDSHDVCHAWSCHSFQSVSSTFSSLIGPPSIDDLRVLGCRHIYDGPSSRGVNVFYGGSSLSLSANLDTPIKMAVSLKNAHPISLVTSITIAHDSRTTKVKGRSNRGTRDNLNNYTGVGGQNMTVYKALKSDSLGIMCQIGASTWGIDDGIIDSGVKLPMELKGMGASEMLEKHYNEESLNGKRPSSREEIIMKTAEIQNINTGQPTTIFSGTVALKHTNELQDRYIATVLSDLPLVANIGCCTILLAAQEESSNPDTSKESSPGIALDCALGGTFDIQKFESIHASIESSIKRRLSMTSSKEGGKPVRMKLNEDIRILATIKYLILKADELKKANDVVSEASTFLKKLRCLYT
jgi:hypothetical protein